MFAVPNVSISGQDWLVVGKKLFDELAPAKRDFMIHDIEGWIGLRAAPIQYARRASAVEKVLQNAWNAWRENHPDQPEIIISEFRLRSGE